MKNILKVAVIVACAVPLAANAALVYTPPQAMVLTCDGTAPNVLGKTSALATFACANGQAPQAVGVTSGLGNMLGLASGAAALVASEAVPSMALPAVGGGSGAGSNGSGNGSGSGANGSGSGANSSGNGNGANGNGSSGNGNGSGSNSGSGSGAGNGSNASGSGSGSNAGSNGSGSGASGSGNGNGSGSGANSSGSGTGNGSNASGSGSGSTSPASNNGGGGFFGRMFHAVGAAAAQIGGQISQQLGGATAAQGPVLTGPIAAAAQSQDQIPSNAPTQNVSQAAGFPGVDAWLLQQMRANKAAGATSNGMIHIVVTPVSVSPFTTYQGDERMHTIYWGTFSAMVYYKGAPIITTGPQPGWVSAPQSVTFTVAPQPGDPEPSYVNEVPGDLGTPGWEPMLNLYGDSPLNYEPAGPLCRAGPRLPCDHQMLPTAMGPGEQLMVEAAIDKVAAALGLQNYGPEIDWEN